MTVKLLSWSSNCDTTTDELGSVPIEDGMSSEIKAAVVVPYSPRCVPLKSLFLLADK